MKYIHEGQKLIAKSGNTTMWLEPWGTNSLRVRMSRENAMNSEDWALFEKPEPAECCISITESTLVEPWLQGEKREAHTTHPQIASITCGNITASFNEEGWLTFRNQKGEILLSEYWRNRDRIDRYCVPIHVDGRELKPIPGSSDYKLTARFEAFDDEKIYGLGQYQEGILNKKGAVLELAQRNTQASVPFLLSSRGYGFLWNNPAIGTVVFGTNKTEWTAESTKKMDYFITAGDTPAQILQQYTAATGTAPMMPEYGMGFWQCKLRYRTQQEVLNVVRKHKSLGLPMDVVVIDFFHWTKQGDFKFSPYDFPDPEGMIKELKDMGVELMVSVWPTVDSRSENYAAMADAGYLINADRGININSTWMGDTLYFDTTNPGARQFVWDCCKKNYFDKGIKIFWLDEAEPEYGPYDFDNYRYYLGSALSCSNIYPALYAKGYYDGMTQAGIENPLNLVRCAWAGSQRYGALIWSGDVCSSFRSMREQLQAGLNMGIAGIPWWTTDIGGFLGGSADDPNFRELLVRWFEWGAFCPVFRLHGERVPHIEPSEPVIDGVAQMFTGSDNEVWSYGEDNLEIFKKYLFLREQMRPYIRECMKLAHENGSPVIRTMFYEFPEEECCWNLTDQYMFGPDMLVAPILEHGARSRCCYLPAGHTWHNAFTGQVYEGGRTISVDAPLNIIPVFLKDGLHAEMFK